MKVTLFEVTFDPVEVELPEKCPGCGADFRAEGSISEGNWTDCSVVSHITSAEGEDEEIIEGEGETRYGDDYFPVDVMCKACDLVLYVKDGKLTSVMDQIASAQFAPPEKP